MKRIKWRKPSKKSTNVTVCLFPQKFVKMTFCFSRTSSCFQNVGKRQSLSLSKSFSIQGKHQDAPAKAKNHFSQSFATYKTKRIKKLVENQERKKKLVNWVLILNFQRV